MNDVKYTELLKDKFSESNVKVKKTILVNGSWGIGKTFTTKKIIEDLSYVENHKIIYISLFGIQDLSDLKKEIIKKVIFPTFSSVDTNIYTESAKHSFKKISSTLFEKKLGVSLDLFSYIENMSLNSLGIDKNYIFIIDDLERKSDNFSMKELLGVLETITSKSNCIILSNYEEISDDDKEVLDVFKEKIIDNEYIFNKISDSTLEAVTDKFLNKNIMSTKDFLSILSSLSKEKNDEYSINNLRILIKTITLLNELYVLLNPVINHTFKFKEDEVKVVLVVIKNKFSKKKININNIKTNPKGEFYNWVLEFYNTNHIEDSFFKEYFENDLPCIKDLNKLWNAHLLSVEEFKYLYKSAIDRVKNKELDYFRNQRILIKFKFFFESVNKNFNKKYLLDLANELYTPHISDISYIKHETNYWDEVNDNSYDDSFVVEMNRLNQLKFEKCKNNYSLLKEYFDKKDFENCDKIIINNSYLKLSSDNLEYLLSPLIDDKISSDYWKFLMSLCYHCLGVDTSIDIEALINNLFESSPYKYRHKRILEDIAIIDREIYENERNLEWQKNSPDYSEE